MKLKDALYLFTAPAVSLWALTRAGLVLKEASIQTSFVAAGYAALAILVPFCAILVHSLSNLHRGNDLERHSKRAETAATVCEICAGIWGVCFLAIPVVSLLSDGYELGVAASLLARAAVLGFILPLSFRIAGYIRVYIHETYYIA